MAKESVIDVACDYCEATGVLPPKGGIATVCNGCSGRGFRELIFTPFTGRKKRVGVRVVRRAGAGILNENGGKVPYTAFLKGRMP